MDFPKRQLKANEFVIHQFIQVIMAVQITIGKLWKRDCKGT